VPIIKLLKTLIGIGLMFCCLGVKAQQPVARMKQHLTDARIKDAISLADSCILKGFQPDSALYHKALAQLMDDRKGSAKITIHRLQEEYPAYYETSYLIGLLSYAEEKYAHAIDAFTALLQHNPDHAKALYNRSLAYGQLDNFKEAIEDLEKLVVIRPEFAAAHYSLGYWKEFAGNYPEAAKSYERSITLDPKNFDAYLGLAFVYQNMKEITKACEVVSRAISAGSQIAEDVKSNYCK
jgi:tetratricopeptide (TPR) repeat protein